MFDKTLKVHSHSNNKLIFIEMASILCLQMERQLPFQYRNAFISQLVDNCSRAAKHETSTIYRVLVVLCIIYTYI